MFTPEDRARTSADLIAAAAEDEHLLAAALVGSAASSTQDNYSDIDLAVEVSGEHDLATVVQAWSQRMYTQHDAVAHLDLWDGPVLYRVFVTSSTLQIDLSFWPAGTLACTSGAFRSLFDRRVAPTGAQTSAAAATSTALTSPDAQQASGLQPTEPTPLQMGWLYALHARSSIARGRRLQGLHMLNQMRDHIAVAACQRLGLPAADARGVDDLPVALRQQLLDAVARDMTPAEARRCLQRLAELLVREAATADAGTAHALAPVMSELVSSAVPVRRVGVGEPAGGTPAG